MEGTLGTIILITIIVLTISLIIYRSIQERKPKVKHLPYNLHANYLRLCNHAMDFDDIVTPNIFFNLPIDERCAECELLYDKGDYLKDIRTC